MGVVHAGKALRTTAATALEAASVALLSSGSSVASKGITAIALSGSSVASKGVAAVEVVVDFAQTGRELTETTS